MEKLLHVYFNKARLRYIYRFKSPDGFMIREFELTKYFGLKLPKPWQNNFLKRFLYKTMTFIFLFLVITFAMGVSADVYVHRTDFAMMGDNLCLMAGIWLVVSKIAAFVIKLEDTEEVLRVLSQLLTSNDREKYTELRDTGIVIHVGVVCLFRLLCNLLGCGFFISKAPEDPTPVRLWYPYNIQYSPMRELMYFHQTFAIFYAVNIITIIDGLYSFMWFQIAIQYNILSKEFQDIEEYCSNKRKSGIDIEKIYEDRLNILIRRHQFLLKLTKTMNGITRAEMFAQIFASNSMMCLSAFGLSLTMNQLNEFFSFMVFMICAVAQLLTWSVYGQQIINNSFKIAESAYKSGWDKRRKSFAMKIYLIIQISQKPVTIDGVLYVFSCETFVHILRHSYSFFTLLNSLSEDE